MGHTSQQLRQIIPMPPKRWQGPQVLSQDPTSSPSPWNVNQLQAITGVERAQVQETCRLNSRLASATVPPTPFSLSSGSQSPSFPWGAHSKWF